MGRPRRKGRAACVSRARGGDKADTAGMSSTALQVAPLVVGYGLLVAAQTLGPEIVGAIHGPAAKAAAELPPEDVAPGTPLLELCDGYASHHFDSIGNSLHFSGMTAGLVSVLVGLFGSGLTKLERVISVLYWAPLWYLYAVRCHMPSTYIHARTHSTRSSSSPHMHLRLLRTQWVGHFGMQKDVPAVFTYGLTPKSYFSGEFCSVLWVYTGRVFDEKGSIIVAAGKTVPWRFNFAFGVAMLVLIGALTPPGFLWQKAMRAYAPDSQARITSAITGASVSAALTVAAIAAALA